MIVRIRFLAQCIFERAAPSCCRHKFYTSYCLFLFVNDQNYKYIQDDREDSFEIAVITVVFEYYLERTPYQLINLQVSETSFKNPIN